jgi:N-glycosylase/DNA lyase
VKQSATSLETTLRLEDGSAVPLRLARRGSDLFAESPGRLPADARRFLVAAGRRILSLDLDLTGFYELARRERRFRWIAETGSGRLLRCPTVFEDLIKLILTTNCSWSLTEKMVASLVRLYGARAADGTLAFPGPEALAGAGERALREDARLGYRAPFVQEIARSVAAGEVDPESWEGDGRSPRDLKAEIMRLPGAGPYVAENLLKLLGRPDGLALDSWMRSEYARLYHGGRRVRDSTIGRRYKRFGEWAGLAIWCDLTRRWFASGDLSKVLELFT